VCATLRWIPGFLRLILAPNGYICIGIKLDHGYHHRFFTDFDDAAAFALQEDALGKTVYHACGTFLSPVNRKQVNVAYLKSLWSDVDVGDDKPYKTRKETEDALTAFLQATGLPRPTIVYSGPLSLHLYWVLDEPITKDIWRPAAVALRELMKQHGFLIDPARSADSSSVLRPPGTHNRKHGSAHPVTIAHLAPPVRLADLGLKTQVQARPDRRTFVAQPQPAPDAAAFGGGAMPPPAEHVVARVFTALTYTESSDRNEVWFPFGGAIHDLAGWPEDLRYALWKWWSIHMDPTGKFDDADQQKTWESLGRDYKGKRATLGSIFKHAQKKGWDSFTIKPLPDEIKALVPPPVEVKPTVAGDALMAAAQQLCGMAFTDRLMLRKKVAADYGVGVGDLDKLMRFIENSKVADEEGSQQGQALNFAEPEPWPEPIDGRELVRELARAIRHNIVIRSPYLLVLALWCIHTYLFDVLKCTPRLIIRAATEGSGKTLLMTLLRHLVWRPLKSINMSSAAMFRSIDKFKPTLLLDEASRMFEAEHGTARDMLEAVIAILDSGFEPGDSVVRASGEDNDVREFFVHTPAALAVLKKTKLPRTLVSRSIYIPLDKKLRTERAVPFSRYHDVEPLQQLARRIRRWCDDNRERLQELLIARIERERDNDGGDGDSTLFNRLADKWRPLFAVAEATGFLREVQDVAAELTKLEALHIEDASDLQGVTMLADCKRIFDGDISGNVGAVDWLSSIQLAGYLKQIPERPWASMGRDGITPHMVAKILADFDIYPERPTTRGQRSRGYTRAMFENAWNRHLSPTPNSENLIGHVATEFIYE
jgi:putative DNA primase/helicase